MLSQLKSYLFGGGPSVDGGLIVPAQPSQVVVQDASFILNSLSRSDEEDWVLVDSEEVIGDLDGGKCSSDPTDLEESWIVTQEGRHHHHHQRHNKRRGQPKGTKPRRVRSKKTPPSSSGAVRPALPPSLEDAESNTSSIAIVPSPEPSSVRSSSAPSAAAAVLAASSDAQQVAAITAARTAKVKSDKSWMSRKNLVRGNQTALAASGRNNRRSHLMVSRLCGSNNNRNSHKY